MGLVRCRTLWPVPALVVFAGLVMLSFNADAYMFYVYYDPQTVDEQLDAYHFDVTALHTSGLEWAQLAALAVGAFLVLRDGRLTGRPAPSVPPTGPGQLLLAKAGAAALCGVLLVAVDLAVVLPLAAEQAAEHWVRQDLGSAGIVVPERTLTDGSVWPVALRAAVGAPLFAVIGIGLAALFGRWWAVTVTVLVPACGALYVTADPFFGALTAPNRLALAATLAPSLGAAVLALLLGYGATRWRLARAAAGRQARPSLDGSPR
ncbi:hypothetical protein GCM10022225_47670 [Plantactinospora mayteni]|uniref:Uncharacterized protein n=1 Tax=Plantactinospora mayteni TaxID=566021 RepID=A0ABQ4ESU9_9ACTN|nr:hypothetical protein Pma05_42950 [Plantactinospora mayteni]